MLERELIARVESAAEACEELFALHKQPLLRYLRALGLREQDCEDVLQEAFLALHHHLVEDRPRTNLRAWLFQVTHNLGLKSRSRLRFWEILLDRFCDLRLNPEENAASHQRQRKLLAVIQALPQRDRSCLALKAEGLTYREIAEVVGISLGSVAAAIARALDRIERMEGRRRP